MLLAKTVETTGIVNNQHQLKLDESLPITESSRVRVIVIVTEEAQPIEPNTTLVCENNIVGVDKNKRLNNLPDIFYTPVSKNKYRKFVREEIYNG
ncbi:hypothetical protein QUF50_05065 [Thiotrichales bacterium HSG1]|nr:hypothetical protein [Candidatus Halobeggiatoa sp. HSG11]MDM8568873.1 hypothetical protein [Thiotrichales bacterium HSG1]